MASVTHCELLTREPSVNLDTANHRKGNTMYLIGYSLSGLVVRLAAHTPLPGHRKKERLAPALLRVAGSLFGGIPGNLFWSLQEAPDDPVTVG